MQAVAGDIVTAVEPLRVAIEQPNDIEASTQAATVTLQLVVGYPPGLVLDQLSDTSEPQQPDPNAGTDIKHTLFGLIEMAAGE